MINVQIDGATNEITKKSGAGVIIKANDAVLEYSFPLNEMSNHEAEFYALLKAVEICAQKFPNEMIAVQTDSQLVVNAVEKNYVKNEIYKQYLTQIIEIANTFAYFFIKWIPSEQNKHADRLAKNAIYKNSLNNS